MIQSTPSAGLEEELEALRREISQPPILEEGQAAADEPAAEATSARGEAERVLRELQERLADATGEAERIIASNPLASVAAAFLLGVLVANVLSRGK